MAHFIVDKVLNEITGESTNDCFVDKPRERFFIGSLYPVGDTDEGDPNEFNHKLRPSSMGFKILYSPLIDDQSVKICISLIFSIFYKAYPSFQERDKYETIHYYKKCEIAIPDIKLTVDPIQPSVYDVANNIEIASAVQQGRNHAQRIVNADPFAYREGTVMKRLREAKTEQEYLGYIESIKGDVVAPPWDFALEIHSKPAGNYHLLQVFLKNTTIENPNELNDSCLFNPKLSVRFEDAQLHPYEFNLLSRDYRYDRELWGVGHNCGVIVSNERNEVKTTLSPIYYQHRYVTRDRVRPAFEGLSADPFPILWSIRREMAAFQTEWENELQRFQRKRSIEEYGECLKDLENFKAEIRRFEAGVQLLEQEPLALEAFRLLNQTFLQKDLQRKSPFASWRMFQIVFIVMLIPDVVSREYPTYKSSMTDKADVIWFPTGGGKTEAYLGLTIFAAFFDRLRGKSSGVTSWIRFPLRLLSIQQFQRIAEIYAEAEKIRLQHPIIGGKEYDCFSVGYFVGEGNTPNQLNKPFIRRFMDDPYFRERYKMIERCPYCGEASISIEIDEFVMRMYHRCNNPQCHFDVLPLHIVDREIYRYLPTLIISTVDKIASIGSQRRFTHILGNTDELCSLHGYMSCGECSEDRQCSEPVHSIKLHDPSPSLIIQDELHLLRESFGTFASHYESFVDSMQQKINAGARAKVIAATATIEEYENQISHLYNRKANRFPSPGYELRSNFYAVELDEISRIFVGIMPHGVVQLSATKAILAAFHELIQNMKINPQYYIGVIGLETTQAEFEELIQLYEVSLTYVNSRDDASSISRLIDNQIDPEFASKGLGPLSTVSLTGASSFKEIRDVLVKLEEPHLFSEDQKIDTIVATSLISHGVDVERLNFMLFHGMPRNTAEYIQSNSRVGRNHVGIDFVCFHPSRERDRSFFRYFTKYNEFCERLVEPVPLNRWSKFSIKKTLPGLFMGIILQYYQPKLRSLVSTNMFFSKGVQEAIAKGYITEEEVSDLLKASYGVRDEEQFSASFSKDIERMVRRIFLSLRNPSEDKLSKQIEAALGYGPMTSLRDIEAEVPIYADSDSHDFRSRMNRRFRK